jgi:hypothetical protein
MPSSGMLCRMARVRADVSEDPSTPLINSVVRIGELGSSLAVN